MVDVLYIAGEGRSGSTILGGLIGEYPGFFHVGELHYLWEKGLSENRLCGCGQKFLTCNFWCEVLAAAFGDGNKVDVDAMLRAEKCVSRVRKRSAAVMFSEPPLEAEQFAAYTANLSASYSFTLAPRRIIVDSSKLPITSSR
jgi:hypothetical protein